MKKRRLIVFLDIDGVLNSANWADEARERGRDVMMMSELDPLAVSHLNMIVEATGAEVVVSSTWRIGKTVERLQDLLDTHGFVGKVIDKTKELRDMDRGHEIQLWMDENGVENTMDIVILDDTPDMAHLLHRLVQPSFLSWGLTKVHAKIAIDMFDRDTSQWVD